MIQQRDQPARISRWMLPSLLSKVLLLKPLLENPQPAQEFEQPYSYFLAVRAK
jgi:hypothetical protein